MSRVSQQMWLYINPMVLWYYTHVVVWVQLPVPLVSFQTQLSLYLGVPCAMIAIFRASFSSSFEVKNLAR